MQNVLKLKIIQMNGNGIGTDPTGGGSGSIPVSDVGTAAATVYSAIQSSETARKNREAAKELAAYGYSKDLEMWERQNIYNSPAAQMERLKAAGLNPRLIYGTSGNTGQATQLPKYQAPRPEYTHRPLDLAPAIEMYQRLQNQKAQVDYVRSQQKLSDEKSLTEAVERVGKTADSKMKSELSKYAYEMAYNEQLKKASEADTAYLQKEIGYRTQGAAMGKIKAESQVRQVEAELATKYNMRLSDAWQYRMAIQVMEMMGIPVGKLLKSRDVSWNLEKYQR